MPWSMKTERDFVQLAGSELRVEQIAAKLKISPQAVIKIGRRLGIRLRPLELKRNGRWTTK
jgi:Mn-dependent DtxR family transcriptional regulator